MINLFLLSEKFDNTYYSRRRMFNMDSETFAKYQEQNDYLNALPYEPSGYRLASTPLNDCIMAAMPMVNAFRKRYAIDKMNTIFLTDGHSDGNDRKIFLNPTEQEIKNNSIYKTDRGYFIGYTSYKSNMILRDTKTKKEYLVDFRAVSYTHLTLPTKRIE